MNNLTEKFTGPGANLLKAIRRFMNFIIIAAGCTMALTFFLVVILRYGFDADLFAYEEWLMAVSFWMFFMASAIATHNNVHINADILSIFINSEKVNWVRMLVVKTLELLILLYLCYLGYVMIAEEVASYPMWQKTIALKIPFVVPRLGIALGFLMMAVYTVLYIYVLIKEGPDCLVEGGEEVAEGI